MTGEILFRRLDDPVPSWSLPGIRWVVEFWTAEMAYPIAQAWVLGTTVVSPNTPMRYLDWLHVMDEYRRKGVATKLMDAILARWPGLWWEGATDAGEKFEDAYRRNFPEGL